MLLKTSAFLLSIFLFPVQSYSQETETEKFSDRLFVGGNVGFQFGTVTYIEVAPIIGYRITDRWSAGVGGRYSFYKDNVFNYQTSLYGANAFTRFTLFQGFYAVADFQMNNFEVYEADTSGSFSLQRQWVPSLLLGAGYSQNLGGKVYANIELLYDVLQDPNSPYFREPVFRGGISIGL